MKNIYLLPTNKPTRGLVLLDSRYRIEKGLINYPKDLYPNAEGYDVYITSDEEIKDGDWVYCKHLNCILQFKNPSNRHFYKKIILTTDKDLINDGIQAIDDEFLEWFVENPSCEEVEVDIKTPDKIEIELNIHGHDIGLTEIEFNEWLKNGGLLYKIVIPKEEHKQKFDIDTCRYFDIEVGCENEKCICENIPKEKPKQETLTEARVNNLIKLFGKDFDLESSDTIKNCNVSFEEGAKWQQEQNKKLYNEEEVIKLLKGMRVVCTFGSSEEIEDYINNIKK